MPNVSHTRSTESKTNRVRQDYRKLTDDDVLEIRRRWARHLQHKCTMQRLGDEYGVTRQMIELIVNNKKRIFKNV